MIRFLRRASVVFAFGLLVFCGQPLALIFNAWRNDRPATETLPAGFVDDVSHLNRTRVAEVWDIPGNQSDAEEHLRLLLQRAKEQRLPVSIAGARHSMGGHTISPDGVSINMLPFNGLSFDVERKRLTAGAGARWNEVIPYLDVRGLSVAIMQSNSDFSVGGSLSVNCHGWQIGKPPISASVESFRLMLADGRVVKCSRQNNVELFSLALGGYGLFGIILDAELRVVPNDRYRLNYRRFTGERAVAQLAEQFESGEGTELVFGRICIVPDDRIFLREATLTSFSKASTTDTTLPELKPLQYPTLRREMFRAQIGSREGKETRWTMETSLGFAFAGSIFSRNQLMSERVDTFTECNTDRTDILVECFIPRNRTAAFIERLRPVIRQYGLDLLNITVRSVHEDRDTFLRYSDTEMLAVVFLFNQPRSEAADIQLKSLTRELIDTALDCGGRYYLPYRLHTTREQFHAAYPQAEKFFARKRHYDPDERFQNQFYLTYGR